MNRSIIGIVFLSVFLLLGCNMDPGQEQAEELLTTIRIDYKDPVTRKILDHQDRLQTDSLLQYFRYRDPTYRFLAMRAFASIPGERMVDTLATMLKDPIPRVQQAAAYALGQIQSNRAEPYLIEAFQNHDSLGANNPVNATILEAIGKCGSANTLTLLSQVTTYQKSDDWLLLGQARAIYRFMLRGITQLEGTQHMVNLLADPGHEQQVRVLAANYLARADIDLSDHAEVLTLIFENEGDPEVQLHLPQALIKTGVKNLRVLLQSTLANELDYRIRCNTLRAMGRANYDLFRRNIHRDLYDKNVHVATVASLVMLDYGKSRYWREYMNLSLDDFPWQIKINLLQAVNKFIPGGNAMFRDINDQKLQQRIRSSDNEYEQAAAILALAENPRWYKYIINFESEVSTEVLQTAAIKALAKILQHPNFPRQRKELRQQVVDRLVAALGSGDVGQVDIASIVLDPKIVELQSYGYDNVGNLAQDAISKLELPRDMEAQIAIKRKVAELNGSDYRLLDDLVHTHQVDWSLLDGILDSTRATIKTTKGSIVVSLLPEMAPGTVANFVDLANLNYYAAKPFHRIVPVFVIQGGCNRGDGYGSMDYNIRSELGQQYFNAPGYIGMASAGRHTESAQWFITQTATPHLDGRYTIFGRVLSGMDVVNAIEVGDQIEYIQIHEPTPVH